MRYQQAPDIFPCPSGSTWAKPSGDHIALGGFVLFVQRQNNVRRSWMTVIYLVALAIAMMGWLWLIVWLARRLI
jgi:hypothetical protein